MLSISVAVDQVCGQRPVGGDRDLDRARPCRVEGCGAHGSDEVMGLVRTDLPAEPTVAPRIGPWRGLVRIVSLNAWGGAVFDSLARWLPNIGADVLCLQEVTRTPGMGGWTLVEALREQGDLSVLCGDLNLLPTSDTFRVLAEIGLVDLVGEAPTRTSLYPKPVRSANYVLVSNVEDVQHFEAPATPEVSDHRPLVLDI